MPPTESFPVGGTVVKPDGSTALSGATVTAYNETKGEELNSNALATTDSNGTYTVDLANFTTAYSNGDVILIEARNGYQYAQSRFTLNTGDDFKTVNLTCDYVDPLQMIKELLEDNWQKSRTSNVLPTFSISKDRATELDMQQGDIVRIYALRTVVTHNGFGATSAEIIHAFTVDVVSGYSSGNSSVTANEQALKMREEVWRILKNNINAPVGGTKYNVLDPMRGYIDLSDGYRKLGKFALDGAVIESNQTW